MWPALLGQLVGGCSWEEGGPGVQGGVQEGVGQDLSQGFLWARLVLGPIPGLNTNLGPIRADDQILPQKFLGKVRPATLLGGTNEKHSKGREDV